MDPLLSISLSTITTWPVSIQHYGGGAMRVAVAAVSGNSISVITLH